MYLAKLSKGYFERAKSDKRDYGTANDGDEGTNEKTGPDDDGVDEDVEEILMESVAAKDDFVSSFVSDIATVGDIDVESGDKSKEVEAVETGNNSAGDGETTDDLINNRFDAGNSSKGMLELKAMLRTTNIALIGSYALKIMELLQLGKIERGSVLPDGKYNSLNGRWFGCKTRATKQATSTEVAPEGTVQQYIGRDTLVKVKCKRGRVVTVEWFCVLCLFSKHYNKWYVHWENDRVPFTQDSKHYKVMMRMVEREGNDIKEVELEIDGS